jgi:hypothetical protein
MDRARGKTRSKLIGLLLVLCASAYGNPFEQLEEVARQAATFGDFLARPKLLAAYKKALEGYYGASKFQCESFETILGRLRELNARVPGFGQEIWRVQPDSELTYFGSRPGSQSRARWTLAAPTRKLHAIWNDPSQRGCVSEDCGKAEVSSPERWAVGLPGTRAYLLHKEDRFQGSGVVVLPVVRGSREHWLVAPTGSGPLKDTADYSKLPAEGAFRASLFDLLVDELSKQSEGRELVSVRNDPKSPEVARLERLRPAKPAETFAGYLDEFKPASGMASQIARVLPRKCFARKGAEAINLFAGFGSNPASGSAPMSGGVRDLLVQVGNPNNLSGVVSVPPSEKPALGQELAQIMKQDADAALREKAALALSLLNDMTPSPALPAPARTPASNGSPDKLPEYAVSAKSYDDDFRKALADPSPGVRGVAASALASRGDRSPAVDSALSQAMGSTSPTPAGLSPGNLAAMAAAAKNNGPAGITPADMGSLFDRLADETDPFARDRLLDELSRALMRQGGEDMRREIERRASTNPQDMSDLIDRTNRANKDKVCEPKQKLEKAKEKENAARSARSAAAEGATDAETAARQKNTSARKAADEVRSVAENVSENAGVRVKQQVKNPAGGQAGGAQ